MDEATPRTAPMAAPLLDVAGFVLKRNWYVPALGIASMAFGVWALFAGPEGPLPLGVFALWMGPFLTVFPLWRNAFPLSRPVRVCAHESRVVLGEGGAVREVSAEDIVEAKLVPRAGPQGDTVADFRLRTGERIRLWLTRVDAVRLLGVLRVGVGERRASFARVLPFGHRYRLVLLMLALPFYLFQIARALLHHGDLELTLVMWPLPLLVLAGLPAWLLIVVSGRVVVGADGITLAWFFRKRFVAFKDIVAVSYKESLVSPDVTDTVLELGKRRFIRLRTAETPDREVDRGVESKALYAHVMRAWAAWRERGAAVDAPAFLARGDRLPAEWRTALEALALAGAGYRAATVSLEKLLDIVRDPQSAPDVRAGAAVALLRGHGPSHKATVRLAGEASLEPSTRDALVSLAEAETEADLDLALSHLARR